MHHPLERNLYFSLETFIFGEYPHFFQDVNVSFYLHQSNQPIAFSNFSISFSRFLLKRFSSDAYREE